MEICKRFTSLISPSIEQQIELDRRRKIKIDKLFDTDTQTGSTTEPESEIILSEEECVNEVSDLEDPRATDKPDMEIVATKFAAAKRKDTRPSKARMKQARNVALQALLSKNGAQDKWKSNQSQTESAKKVNKNVKGKSQNSPTFLSDEEIRSIFENNTGYKSANQPLPPGFVSTQKNKRKAFAERIASIPTEGKAEARADRALLDEATKTFNPSARPDGEGKWKIRGLKTSLMANQVCVPFPSTFIVSRTNIKIKILAASWMVRMVSLIQNPATDKYSANAKPATVSQMVACSVM